jgi:ribosome recycling factor
MNMSDEIEIDLDGIERRMDGAMISLKTEFAALRTGRASGSIVEPIMVPAYGNLVPINQCATINVPEPRMITVTVWDKTLLGAVEKAIRNSGLGLNPVGDGMTLRLPIPELNEERRQELAKIAGGYAENARIAVRNVRRDGMDQIRKAKAAGMGEDDQKIWSDEIQSLTDAAISGIDRALDVKQHEIMQV